MAGLETPAGLYHVQDKEVNPVLARAQQRMGGLACRADDSAGTADPIKARWMGIFNGAGIHGTDELSSLGSAASHGCIRMAISGCDRALRPDPSRDAGLHRLSARASRVARDHGE